MEMCYDGALVMPSSYALMDEDEMCYVEGGVSLSAYWVGVGIDVVISLACAAITGGFTSFMKTLVGKYGKKMAGLHFGNMAKRYAIKYFGACVGAALGSVLGVALTVVSVVVCPGAAIANYWATHDKNCKTKGTIEI